MADPIDTKKVTERRKLRFENVAACIAEVERIKSADEAGSLKTLGNWTAGEILSHIAAWIEYGYEGFPMKAPPFFIRWYLKWQLGKMIRDGIEPAMRIPGVEGGTYGFEKMPTPAACDRLISALERMQSDEDVKFHSPAFGPVSNEDRIQFSLRHAELHLGFLDY
ncbi:MAG: DUF1569 domain-containing protein [bacterium]|nr:DUF1569 domain-containing protein [bacterium]